MVTGNRWFHSYNVVKIVKCGFNRKSRFSFCDHVSLIFLMVLGVALIFLGAKIEAFGGFMKQAKNRNFQSFPLRLCLST